MINKFVLFMVCGLMFVAGSDVFAQETSKKKVESKKVVKGAKSTGDGTVIKKGPNKIFKVAQIKSTISEKEAEIVKKGKKANMPKPPGEYQGNARDNLKNSVVNPNLVDKKSQVERKVGDALNEKDSVPVYNRVEQSGDSEDRNINPRMKKKGWMVKAREFIRINKQKNTDNQE